MTTDSVLLQGNLRPRQTRTAEGQMRVRKNAQTNIEMDSHLEPGLIPFGLVSSNSKEAF